MSRRRSASAGRCSPGWRRCPLTFPPGWSVDHLAAAPPALPPQALPAPRSVAVPGGPLLVVVNDAQRATPTPWLMSLLDCDWSSPDVRIAVATGCHAPPTEPELREIFGGFLDARPPAHPRPPRRLGPAGATSGQRAAGPRWRSTDCSTGRTRSFVSARWNRTISPGGRGGASRSSPASARSKRCEPTTAWRSNRGRPRAHSRKPAAPRPRGGGRQWSARGCSAGAPRNRSA